MQKKQYNFPVELTSIATRYKGTSVKIPSRKAVLRTDTLYPLGIVSTKYALLKHEDVINGFRKALQNERYVESIQVTKNGAHLYATYSLPQHTVEVTPGDRISLQFVVKNSYDGSNALQIALGAFRIVCSNGMMIGKKFFTFTQKHVGSDAGVDVAKLKDKVDMLVGQFGKALPLMQEMAKTPLTTLGDDIDALFDHKKLRMPKYLLEEARAEYYIGPDASLWGYYNSLTSVITHKMKKPSPALILEYGQTAWKAATSGLLKA